VDAGGTDAGGTDAGADAGPGDLDAALPDSGADAGSDAGSDAGVFSPASIPGLVLWLRSDALPLGNFTTWTDESGAGNDALANGPMAVEEVDGHVVVRMGGRWYFTTPAFRWGDDASVFAVTSLDMIGPREQRILHTDFTTHFAFQVQRTPDLGVFVGGTGIDEPFSIGWHILAVVDQADVTDLWIDGTSRPTARHMAEIPDLSLPLGIGGNPTDRTQAERMTGHFAELLVWDEALDASQRAEVDTYLRDRWRGLGGL